MSTKALVTIGMIVGSIVGSYLPVLFGVDPLSYTSLFSGGIGSIIGILLGYKLSQF